MPDHAPLDYEPASPEPKVWWRGTARDWIGSTLIALVLAALGVLGIFAAALYFNVD